MTRIFSLLLLVVSTTAIAQPTISAISPSSGHVGSSVTITGTGFNTTAANDIVYFGATRATVTSASSTSLTVQVPAGATYAPVNVNNSATSLTGIAKYPFLPTYDNSAFVTGATGFEVRKDFACTAGAVPLQTLIQDMDGDGKSDLVVLTNIDISVYRNTGTTGSITAGSFAPPVSMFLPVPVPVYYYYNGEFSGSRGLFSIGDIDGDGKPDIVFTTTNDSVYVMRNSSSGGAVNFDATISYIANATLLSDAVNGVAIGDLDGDGRNDIVCCNASGNISVLKNTAVAGVINGSSFAASVTAPIGTGSYLPNMVAIGDIDGDGKPDVALTTLNTSISVLRNTSTTGSISMASSVDFATLAPDGPDVTMGSLFMVPGQSAGLVIADLDGDGKLDLAVSNNWSNTISVFRNTASAGVINAGSLAGAVVFPSAFQAGSMIAGDFDGDGKVDLAVSGSFPKATLGYFFDELIYVYRNISTPGTISTGSFDLLTRPNGHHNLLSIAAGDLDGDGKPDILSANTNDSNITVLRNAPVAPLAITAVTPSAGVPGAAVTITGTNFNSTPANNVVYFGATRATVTSASSTSLTVTVPEGATFERVVAGNTATNMWSYSLQPFLPTFSDPSYGPSVEFEQHVQFHDPGHTRNKRAVMMDIDGDGDGKADVVALNDSGFAVYRNTSIVGHITTGSFATAIDFLTGCVANLGLSAGDVDGDGRPDVIVASGTGGLLVFRNISVSGTVNFAAPVSFGFNPSSAGVLTATMADLNNDGRPEIITGDVNVGVSIYWNTSTAGSINLQSMTMPQCYDILWGFPWTSSVAIADIDGDGRPDIVCTTADTVVLVYQNMLQGFGFPVFFNVGHYCDNLSVADIDGDGKPDIVAANRSDSTLSILRNVATAGIIDTSSFAPQVLFSTGYAPQSISIADFNGDGKPDILVSCVDSTGMSGLVSVYRNTATPGTINSSSVAVRVDSAAGYGFYSVAGDIDGDGKADIIVCNWEYDTTVPGYWRAEKRSVIANN